RAPAQRRFAPRQGVDRRSGRAHGPRLAPRYNPATSGPVWRAPNASRRAIFGSGSRFRPSSSKSEVAQVSRQAVITPEGLEKLKEEIEHLSTAKRREVAERIKEAREFGDISENAEYDDAKNEQALLEGRIAQLEERLRRATVIDEK